MPDPTSSPPVPEPGTPDSDAALMTAYAQGQMAAFEQLYRRHAQPLHRFVRRVLGSAGMAQADEVFQDTWLRVIQSRERWRAEGASFRTWLFTLAHHRAVDVLRRSGRELSLPSDDEDDSRVPFEPAGGPWQGWPDAQAAAPADAADQAFWRRAGERLLECLDQLPVAQRGAFLLHHDDGLPLGEVAQALGIGFETAKTRLRYAMAKLRTCMGAYLAPQWR